MGMCESFEHHDRIFTRVKPGLEVKKAPRSQCITISRSKRLGELAATRQGGDDRHMGYVGGGRF